MSESQSSSELKYIVVKRHLLQMIEGQEPGAMLPTERTLAEQFGTSRTTVRQALNELVAQGRIVRRQGSGTFVAGAKMEWPLYAASFTEQAAANGMVAMSRILGSAREPATPERAAQLEIDAAAPIWRLDRLRMADGVPMCVETSVLSVDRFPGLVDSLAADGSLHRLLAEQYQVQLTWGEESIEVEPAGTREADLLGIDVGAPLLVIHRTNYDEQGIPIESGTSWMRADRIIFIAHLIVGKDHESAWSRRHH
ncbi:GntR family transcriptional regulator [Raineyella sp. LH-20]|uniref:GntR family transcriptional regulator n=1 Tax=Raineyella sp. LH-20 TaxID=3081204 RepID=UPI00295550CF|nr:GntR family transcriptional regulator [Raineyella sp. LH-20]WOP17825.1 GntR family transcriptional regulator [Raineyella sp. LH-20]